MGQQKQIIISGEPEKTDKEKQKEKTKIDESKAKSKKIEKKSEEIKKHKKTRGKNYLDIKKIIQKSEHNTIEKAVEILKKSVKLSKNNSFEIHISLNLNPKENINLKIKPDKNLVIHSKIGKFSDKSEDIIKNAQNIIKDILLAKPSGKKNFIKSIAICTTQSPSVKIKINENPK